MKDNKIMFFLMMFVAAIAFASCSETEEDSEEFPDWKRYNDEYFDNLYTQAEQKIAAGDKSWKIIRSWILPADQKINRDDNIIVEVLKEGKGTEMPMYTDSVYMAYSGRLLPSKTFPSGYVFDETYKGEFNPDTVYPLCSGISDFIEGFTTALLNMRPGDHWRVSIPSNLAYGNSIKPLIPQYSLLVFDIYLFDFFHPGQKPQYIDRH